MHTKRICIWSINRINQKYDLAELKYIEGETKPSYVITSDEIEDIYEKKI